MDPTPAPPIATTAAGTTDSVDSSPRSRNTDSLDDSYQVVPGTTAPKLRLMCSFGGHIVPRPHDKSLCYIGGDTRIVVVDRHTSLSDLTHRLSKTLLDSSEPNFTLKYQLPNEDLDSLISVTTDEDLDNMIDEYDRLNNNSSGKSSRLRLFLFPSKPESISSIGSLLENSIKSEDWFLNALNGTTSGGLSDSNSVNCLLGLDDDAMIASNSNNLKGVGGTGSISKNQDVHSVPDSPMLDTTSSFGSASSSPSLGNLPPIRVHAVEDQQQKVGIEEQFAQMGVGGNANFRLSAEEVLEYRVFIKADRVSPFDLAASWRAYRENLQPSTVRGIPDVSINSAPQIGCENGSSASLELDLEHYVVPAPATSANSGMVYAANMTETPRSLTRGGVFSNTDGSGNASYSYKDGGVSTDRPATIKELEVIVPDPSKVYSASGMVESKSVGTFSVFQKQDSHRGLFVDRGVGSPRLAKSASSTTFTIDLKPDSEAKNPMPAAAGAVAAAAVADQMLGPKEDRHLAIVLVGLPARGKTFTAAKLTRYLRWLGHDTKHFNVGKYRRLKHGTNQSADFFRADNPEGMEARNEVAALAMDDMTAWMQEGGGQVGIFDATNSTRQRRNMLMKMAEGKCKIIFLETICNDRQIIERNIRLKIQQSPDYAEEADFEAGYQDFKTRLENYEKVYEPVEEGSYIKMIDMVKGHGGQIQVNNISGYLPGRIVFFLVNTHLTPRPILLTRHGQSRDNVRGRIGGDTVISDIGELYAKKLANFVEKRLKNERAASIWTSTLQRTILTANPIAGFPKIQWRALDEINAGVCDGMTYEEIKKNMPEEYESRKKDKLRYRYPRGESYLDVIQRLEPVIIELERQRAPVVVVSHQAVLRALYAYFADRPLKEIPHIEMPLHTIIEIQMGVTGVQEKRYKLMD